MATDYDVPHTTDEDVEHTSIEELRARKNSQHEDEFLCSRCFLVHHHGQLYATESNGDPICADCAS